MVKDYYPISIEKIHKEIKEEEKIKYLIHNNFCLYKYNKGKNKDKLCLNKFKDINDLQFCFMHRWEMRPWLKCQTLGCDGKTKIDTCRKCKKILNTKLPEITNKEILELSEDYENKQIIEIFIPNAKYSIKNYNNHNYFKDFTIYINLILPKYINGIKTKTIKNNEYIRYLRKRKIKKILKNLLNLEILKNVSFYSSIKYISNVPLPPVTYDEKLLLNLDFNDIYNKINNDKINKNNKKMEILLNTNEENNFKKIKDSDGKSLENINNLNITKDIYIQTDPITPETSETSQKCNKCLKFDLLINNLFEINKKIGKEVLLIKPDLGDVYLDHVTLSKTINKNKAGNINKDFFDLKRLIKYMEGIKVHLIELDFKNIEKLTPKPFIKHKKFLELFINNIYNLFNENKYVQYNYNIKNNVFIPNPLK
jgi:hypothetical protein